MEDCKPGRRASIRFINLSTNFNLGGFPAPGVESLLNNNITGLITIPGKKRDEQQS